MQLTKARLKALLATLDKARGDEAFACAAPLKDASGSTHRTRTIRRTRNRERADVTAYGTHGSDYLQADAETGLVSCAACAGTVDATVPADPPDQRVTETKAHGDPNIQ